MQSKKMNYFNVSVISYDNIELTKVITNMVIK